MVAPIVEELSEEYAGKVNFMKMNTDENPQVPSKYGIRSIPSLLFCPKDGAPQMAMGALPKDTFKRAIDEILLQTKAVEN